MIKVSKETYNYVLKRDRKCVLCPRMTELELHHILGRNNRSLINDVDNCVLLCKYCHKKVHNNQRAYRPLLQEYIKEVKSV